MRPFLFFAATSAENHNNDYSFALGVHFFSVFSNNEQADSLNVSRYPKIGTLIPFLGLTMFLMPGKWLINPAIDVH
jgi:hypothetical protein